MLLCFSARSHVDVQTNTQTNTQTNVQTSVIEQLSAIDTLSSSQIALEEAVGFYGQLLALEATRLGLATSWCVLDNAHTAEQPWWQQYEGEQAIWFIAFGYPARVLTHRRSKSLEQLVSMPEQLSSQALPEWFQQAMQAAMIAPTSLSQQPFVVRLQQDEIVLPEQNSITQWLVSVEATSGLFAYVGVGCVKQHIALALQEYQRDTQCSSRVLPDTQHKQSALHNSILTDCGVRTPWKQIRITAEPEFTMECTY